jgi:hypothetical protein
MIGVETREKLKFSYQFFSLLGYASVDDDIRIEKKYRISHERISYVFLGLTFMEIFNLNFSDYKSTARMSSNSLELKFSYLF